ncbi:MAG: hypothetical protein ABI836_01570 [Gemmatimonadota bacterium]
MSIPRHLSILALAAGLLAGCKDKDAPPIAISEAMPNLPLPPAATVVNRSGGPDALQVTFKSAFTPDSMASYYRRVLTSGEWNLVNDDRGSDGTISLYAERNGPPLWVTIRQDPETNGSLLTLGGAVSRPDSTKADSAQRPIS